MQNKTNHKDTPPRSLFTFCLITRDNSDSIIECLDSTLPANTIDYSICDTGSKDNTIALILEWGLKNKKNIKITFYKDEYGYEWNDTNQEDYDFGKARQLALQKVETPAMVWLDTDDVLENASGLPSLVNRLINTDDVYLILCPYRYGVDQYGNDIVRLWRERIAKVTPDLRWSEPVHEYLTYDKPVVSESSDLVVWRHKRKPEHVKRTSRRNKAILARQYNDLKNQGTKPHLRLLQNIAYDYWEHKEWSASAKYYGEFFSRIGELANDNADKLSHQMYVQHNYNNWAKAEMELNNLSKANEIIELAIRSDETNKYTYLTKAELRLRENKLNESLLCLDICSMLVNQPSLLPVNEVDMYTKEYLIRAEILKRQSNFSEAIQMLDRARRIVPDSEAIANELKFLGILLDSKSSFDAYYTLKNQLLNEGNWDKMHSLIDNLPESIQDQTSIQTDIANVKKDYEEYKERMKVKLKGKKRIAIYTGPAYEAWAGDSRSHGIGGSEEMVIGMAYHLQKLGNEVVVYNDCRNLEGTYDGVEYVDFKQYNPNREFDVLIISRLPNMMLKKTPTGWDYQTHKSKRQYLWLHDTTYGQLPTFAFSMFDRILVLSEYHKDIIRKSYGISDNKFYLTRNGIEVNHYLKLNKPHRDNKQIIYCSSYDRGLYEVLLGFKKIKAEVPDALLKVYYGWHTYDARMNLMPPSFSTHPSNMSMKDYKNRVVDLMRELNVVDGGRIGQDELYLEMTKSNIWYYDTWFSEISCITAMRAQLAGAIPVHSGIAALAETVKSGFKLSGDDAINKIIELLKDEEQSNQLRKEAIKAGREFDIVSLAKDWDKLFES